MKEHIFRAYDIRGVVGQDLLIDQVPRFGRALVAYIRSIKPELRSMVVAMDGRIHSQDIKDALVAGLRESGIDVTFIGVCPTPVLYFALNQKGFDAGVMITASHNPAEYNGFKMCLGQESLWGTQIQELKQWYLDEKRIESVHMGQYHELSMREEYVDWLVAHMPALHNMDMPVVFDCGNGAVGAVLPQLIKKMNWSHATMLYPEVDGTYPNHEADPIVEKNMLDLRDAVHAQGASIGIGFDGDGDRMGAMTSDGQLVLGEQLLGIFAQSMSGEHPGMAVVCDINASSALEKFLEEHDAHLYLSACGHSNIKHQMVEHNALLGGELSCHFMFGDRYFGFDDGIYAALRLLEILVVSGQSLDAIIRDYPEVISTPVIRIACTEEEKADIVEAARAAFGKRSDMQLLEIDGVRAQLPYGWGLIRASNTQPVVTVRFEAHDQVALERIKQEFYIVLEPFFDPDILRANLLMKE